MCLPFITRSCLFLLVDDWNCWSSITIQQLEWFPKLFRISSWNTLHIHNMVFALQSWDTLLWASCTYITEMRSVPWLVFEITLIACVIPAFSEGNSFFWAKTLLGIHCSIIAIYVLSKLLVFISILVKQNCIQSKSYKKQKIFFEKQNGFRDGMSSYSIPQKMQRNKGKCRYIPSLGPIPLKKCRI